MKQEELEKKILSHMLNDINAVDTLIEKGVRNKHFLFTLRNHKYPFYAGIFDLIIETKKSNNSLLTKTVFEDKMVRKAKNKKQIKEDEIDGKKAIFASIYEDLKMQEIQKDELTYLIQQLKDKWNAKIIQEVPKIFKDSVQKANQEELDVPYTFAANKIIQHLNENINRGEDLVITTRDLMRDTDWIGEIMEDRVNNPEKYKGVNIGIPPIDEVTNGFREGQLIIFIGQVASGKTTILTNMASHVCIEEEKDVLFFSLEMMEWMMAAKFNARDMRLDYRKLRDGRLTENEKNAFFERLNQRKTHSAGFWHKEMFGNCSIESIEKEIRKEFEKNPIKAIFVDYLGIIHGSDQYQNKKRWEELGEISESLRDIAREFRVPIITAVQANRSAIKKVKADMEKSSIDDIDFGIESVSGSMGIANTADLIFGIYTDFEEGKMRIHQVKNREGNVPAFKMRIIPSESYIGYDESDNVDHFSNSDSSIMDDFEADDDMDIIDELDNLEDELDLDSDLLKELDLEVN